FQSRRGKFRIGDRFDPARLVHSFRIVSDHMCSFAKQLFHQLDSNRERTIIGIRLKRKTPDRDPFLAQHPERLADGLEETRLLALVYALHFSEQSGWRPKLLLNRENPSNVFWEPGPAVSNSSVQKIAT